MKERLEQKQSNQLRADEITIAVTVYDRRDYIKQAIASALNQSVPVKVMVVEDCGPDTGMQRFVLDEFGARVTYIRNTRRRGLFDNWNACLEYCKTPWLSILHDDDVLEPGFVAAMQELYSCAPGLGLYFGEIGWMDEKGTLLPRPKKERPPWRKVSLFDLTQDMLAFPGQLMRVDAARAVGGFRTTSLYCGDSEMWGKLTAQYGTAQISRRVAFAREHLGWGRGTNRVDRLGRRHGLMCVQQKRFFAAIRKQGSQKFFDRKVFLATHPLSSKSMIRNAACFSPLFLGYNYKLLMDSRAPNWPYAMFQFAMRLVGPKCMKIVSQAWRLIAPNT